MRAGRLAWLLLLSSVGCSPQYTDYYFAGRVYDGVAGSRLTDYDIELQYLDRRQEGMVDDDGRYFLGPLTPFNDYTVAVRADGFRSFLSHNVMKVNDELTNNNNPKDDTQHPDESQYFDAYLFPIDVVSPGATIRVSLADSTDRPSGTIRFRPALPSTLADDAVELPAAIAGQVWRNDDDLQFASITRDFTDGTVTLAPGDLVEGVSYAVTIYNVAGHAQLTGATYVPGTTGDTAYVVPRLISSPLAISFNSTQLGLPSAAGEVVFVFNQDVELGPSGTADAYLGSLEQAFAISSPDKNTNGQVNALRPFDPAAAAGSRGLSMKLAGDKLTLSWDPGVALLTTDAADPIRSVTYGGLNGVRLRATDSLLETTLGALLGANSITVQVTP